MEFGELIEQEQTPIYPETKTGYALAHLYKHYGFRYNVITEQVEMRKNGRFEIMRPRDLKNLYAELALTEIEIKGVNNSTRLMSLGMGREQLVNFIGSAKLSNEYNPFTDYLYGLKAWDGKDYIAELLVQLVLESETERALLQTQFTKWMVAIVASLIDDRAVNQQCLILSGRQGIFKTTFLNALVPPALQLDYLYSSKFNFDNKDHYKYLATKMLINLDELATFNRTEIAVLKTVLTDDRVIVRQPYEALDSHLWRRASFCGNTNEDNFLTDETGNRRFLVFRIRDINFNRGFNIDNVYRQALALYRQGFVYWFAADEITEINERNQGFFNRSIEEELILDRLERPTPGDIADNWNVQYKTATAINILLAEASNKININETTKQRIGKVLKKLGFNRIKKRVDGYDYPVDVYIIRVREKPVTAPGAKDYI